MNKLRLFIYAIIIAFAIQLSGPMFLIQEGVNEELVNSWNNELMTIEKDCGKKLKLPSKILVDFGDTEGAIGYCQRFPNGFKIIIDKNYWDNKLDDLGKRQLLLHEMMHCIFKVGHNLKDPNHFMYPEYTPIKESDLLIQVFMVVREAQECN